MATIGIDYTSALRQTAGIGRTTRELVAALARLPATELPTQIRLFAAQTRQPDLPPVPGPSFEWRSSRISERWLDRLWYRLRLPLPVETWAGRLDLFHAPDFFLPPTLPGTRTLVTVHDLSFVRFPDSVMPGMARKLNTWVPRAVARADHITAVSEATRQDLIELYGTPPQKISVLHHGVTSDFQPVTDPARLSAVRKNYGLGSNPFILSVGTVQPRKNYRRLIRAMAHVPPPVSLVIAGGDGWQTGEIYGEVAAQRLEKRVIFAGFVTDADLPALYSAATLFAYPSLYEGFGLPALEAMACGTPVVTADASALPEVVGDAGLLVDPTDENAIAAGINRLLADRDLQRRLSVAGKRRAAQFTWDNSARQLLAIYRRLLEM